ncbi:peptidylprolyl isomerase [Caulobacter sp. KR2-114]|uniref:peptidylprolyl isomerase n=1 Tax=Caulobacter sp. KR2-114 TaxID=3400912 RepID=UPI003C01A7B9
MSRWFALALAPLMIAACSQAQPSSPAKPTPTPSASDILAGSPASDWRPIDPENTVYLDLPKGRVIIELAPAFAPNHVANIKALARAHYFDHAFVVRVQDNYVVQWSQPDSKTPLGAGKATLPAEFDRPAAGAPFDPLPDPDTYAPQVGFSDGFPAARDPGAGRAWLTHCYGMVGAGRDNDADSGGGAELYAVIGNAPRPLDRNVTLVGRVVQGIELMSAMPRGTGDLGFYEHPEQRIPIAAITVAADLPPAQRVALESLRTDSATFARLVDARRNRHDAWYKYASGHVDVCNVKVPVRAHAAR